MRSLKSYGAIHSAHMVSKVCRPVWPAPPPVLPWIIELGRAMLVAEQP